MDDLRQATGDQRHLVVIGASAGGVEALTRLLAALPADFPAPLVVAQHMGTRRPSRLADVLSRSSALAVHTVTGRHALEPGAVFVAPANRDLEVDGTDVVLAEDGRPGPKASVNLLFESAARSFGERLLAVVLSGTGSDGAAGAHVVKRHDGTVIIEDPETARFPGMPQSLAPATVDIVADLERIAAVLQDLVGGSPPTSQPDAGLTLDRLLEEIRARVGIDFASYKRPTILRRLERRMAATGARNIEDYVAYLRGHPEEYQRLVASFLIKVTEFFRDGDLFTQLRQQVLPDVVARARGRGNQIRIWSAGCATGEEAYSLAIALCETLGSEVDRFNIRVFATDVDVDALAVARRGVYPISALSGMSSDLISTYFAEEDGAHAVRARVRSLIVFGAHDLAQRPPFPNIDLILCRNVLIYFTAALQSRALQLFAFSLRDDGYLILGKAETAAPQSDLFLLENPALKIYRRHGERLVIPPGRIDGTAALSAHRAARRRQPANRSLCRSPETGRRARTVPERLHEVLLDAPVGIALINASYDIQLINGAAREALGIRGSATGHDLVHLAQHADNRLLRRAIDQAFGGEPAAVGPLTVTAPGTAEPRHFEVLCHPHPLASPSPSLVALLVFEVTAHVNRLREALASLESERRERERLSNEVAALAEANRELDAANRELAARNAELHATNEEFAVDTEEAQAASEEVETLNEELQATNEELETLNEELQATVEELNTANEDLQARSVELREAADRREGEHLEVERARARLETVLASMESGLLVVDGDGRTVISNPSYEAAFGDPAADPEAEDLSGSPLPRDERPRWRAARGELFSLEFTLTDPDGSRRWFEATGNPLVATAMGTGTGPSGGVVVFRDITDRTLRRLEEELLAIASHELRTPLTAVRLYAERLARMATGGEAAAAAEPGAGGGQPPGGETLRRIADGLTAETGRLAALVSDLLDVSRLQGRIPLHPGPVDLTALMERVAELGRQMAQGLTITLRGPDGPVLLRGDPGRLEQLFMNLLENAITYAADGKRIELTLTAEGPEVAVQVRDHGPGIPASHLPHVFSRFYRVRDGGPTPQGGGLGLGLHIARQIVEAHGGRIDVESTEGRGTAFTVHLPLGPSGAG